MITPAGKDCKYYYEDFHRRSFQECRLIARNPESPSWTPDLCGKCPVPDILRDNRCEHMLLKATVVSQFLVMRRVKVDAYCEKHQRVIAEPRIGCGECARERRM
jgi:hypothetical protein